MVDVLDELRSIVRKSKRSHAEIAAAAGLNQSVLSRLHHNKRGVSVETAQRIARALGHELVIRRKRKPRARVD